MSLKDTKRLVCAGLIGLSLLAAAASVRAGNEHYLPLEVGNSWTYTTWTYKNGTEEITFTITGTEEINGHTYYKFNDYFCVFCYCPSAPTMGAMGRECLLRYDAASDNILMYHDGEEIVRYDFSGNHWLSPYFGGDLKQTGVTRSVPAGEFNDCYSFGFLWTLNGALLGEYLAPNVGVVKYVAPSCYYAYGAEGETVTFELKSYRIGPIEAGVDIEPNTINLKSKGKWLTCYIWLDEEYNIADINPDSVRLEGGIEAGWMWFDEEEQVATAKFSRAEVQEILEVGEVELTVTGELTNGTRFEGTDTIKVIDKGRKKD